MSQARRFECPAKVSMQCERGDGTPRHPKCSRCGSRLSVFLGRWGVFVWRGDARYHAEDALATYVLRGAAERAAGKAGDEYVVRWIHEGMAP